MTNFLAYVTSQKVVIETGSINQNANTHKDTASSVLSLLQSSQHLSTLAAPISLQKTCFRLYYGMYRTTHIQLIVITVTECSVIYHWPVEICKEGIKVRSRSYK